MIYDEYAILKTAFTAAKAINGYAGQLKAQSGPIKSNALASRMDGMRESYNGGIAPLLAIGSAAAVNAVIGKHYSGTLPASTFAQFQAVGTALTALITAYDGVFSGLPNFVSHSIADGHTFTAISLAQLADLSDELDAVIAAVAPLV